MGYWRRPILSLCPKESSSKVPDHRISKEYCDHLIEIKLSHKRSMISLLVRHIGSSCWKLTWFNSKLSNFGVRTFVEFERTTKNGRTGVFFNTFLILPCSWAAYMEFFFHLLVLTVRNFSPSFVCLCQNFTIFMLNLKIWILYWNV